LSFGTIWSGHSGGCTSLVVRVLDRWRISWPCASRMSSVISLFGSDLSA
jgi:hypothetical protein